MQIKNRSFRFLFAGLNSIFFTHFSSKILFPIAFHLQGMHVFTIFRSLPCSVIALTTGFRIFDRNWIYIYFAVSYHVNRFHLHLHLLRSTQRRRGRGGGVSARFGWHWAGFGRVWGRFGKIGVRVAF